MKRSVVLFVCVCVCERGILCVWGGGGGVGACMPPCVRVYIVIVKHFPCIRAVFISVFH